MDINLTAQSFATWPAGIAVVWAIMALITQVMPGLTTRVKVGIQVGVSLLYSLVATFLFIDGDTNKEIAQKGVILFIMVAFSQTALYDGAQKLMGNKGDGAATSRVYGSYGNQGGGDGGRV